MDFLYSQHLGRLKGQGRIANHFLICRYGNSSESLVQSMPVGPNSSRIDGLNAQGNDTVLLRDYKSSEGHSVSALFVKERSVNAPAKIRFANMMEMQWRKSV